MSSEILILTGTALSIGFLHTLLGPDHYIPFIVLARVRQWTRMKTMMITLLCGIGHVLSSVILGFIGVAVGIAVFKLEAIEALRGEIAGWFLIIFGITYLAWGIHHAVRNRTHKHVHLHENGDAHSHMHRHTEEHVHVHKSKSRKITPWILFIIFVFGPCEPLIPILMYPAARGSLLSVVIVASVFGLTTIITMLSIVMISSYGLSRIPFRRFERYAHILAGLAILLCGGAIKFLGL